MYPQDGTIVVWLLPLPRKGEHANGAPLGNTTSRERAFAEAAQEEEKKISQCISNAVEKRSKQWLRFVCFFFLFCMVLIYLTPLSKIVKIRKLRKTS